MNIENISLAQFVLLSETDRAEWYIYLATPEFKTPFDHLGIGEIDSKTFGLIKEAQTELFESVNVLDIIKWLSRFSEKTEDYLKTKIGIFEAYRTFEYLRTELIKLTENERDLLSEQPDGKMLAAGINEFEQFGVYLQLRKLTNGDITKIKEVESIEYNTCFLELYYQKVMNDFNMRYTKNASNRT
jgi:hypothetical protein